MNYSSWVRGRFAQLSSNYAGWDPLLKFITGTRSGQREVEVILRIRTNLLKIIIKVSKVF
jgi:hypothetical protein